MIDFPDVFYYYLYRGDIHPDTIMGIINFEVDKTGFNAIITTNVITIEYMRAAFNVEKCVWELHCEYDYSIKCNEYGNSCFYYRGVNYPLREMPIDEETKVMLLLKYGEILPSFLSEYEGVT